MSGAGPIKLVVVDCYSLADNATTEAAGGCSTGQGFTAVLERLDRRVQCTLVQPESMMPRETVDFSTFDGSVWTGSSSSAYDDDPRVHHLTGMARAGFDSGTPAFGSCFGLQLMVTALRGQVRLNPKGREIGIGRAMTLTDAGRAHPLYNNKPDPFDAVSAHKDEVKTLPPGATVLASNGFSEVQAVEICDGDKLFWGVQYHPEFSLAELAIILKRRCALYLEEGHFGDADELEAYRLDLLALDDDPCGADPAKRLGLEAAVLTFDQRTREISNWLTQVVVPRLKAKS